MIVSIHQPQYLPWIPYFSKIKQSNLFVVLDDVQYQKNGLQNRNYIAGKNGQIRLTIPVSNNFGDAINIVKIADKKILKKHWQSIEMSYKKAIYFEEVAEILRPIYFEEYELLSVLNIDLMRRCLTYLEIETEVIISSTISKHGEKSELILSICKELGATKYLTGSGGLEYLDVEKFGEANIAVQLLEYQFREYEQGNTNQTFVPHLSLIDLVFNQGKNSINYI
jgi:WbqC-like protein family